MSNESDAQKLEEYKEIFNLFDSNKDGIVTFKDIGKLMKRLGQNLTEAELQDIVNDVDEDQTGSFSFNDFLKIMRQREEIFGLEDDLQSAFNVFDKEGNGYIRPYHLKHILRNLGEIVSDDEIAEMIREADFDKDGRISFLDFVQMMSIEDNSNKNKNNNNNNENDENPIITECDRE